MCSKLHFQSVKASMQSYLIDSIHRRFISKLGSSLDSYTNGSKEEVKGESSSEEAYIHELDRKVSFTVLRLTVGKLGNLEVCLPLLLLVLFQNARQCVTRT